MSQEDTPQPEGQAPEDTPTSEGQEPQGDDKPETFSRDYVESLRAESAKNRKKAQEAAAKVQEYEDQNKSELEKLAGKLQKAEQAKAEAEASLLRYEVAQEKEVPAKLVPLLTATDREGLESQADLIVENAKANAPKPEFDGGAREPAPEVLTPEQEHNKLVASMLLGGNPNT